LETISVSRVAVPLRWPSRSTSPLAATPAEVTPSTSSPVARSTERVRGERLRRASGSAAGRGSSAG
jgi:hypothetical protein